MEENKTKGNEKKAIIGLCLAILALMLGVMLMFKGLEAVIPNQWDAQVWDDMYTEKGATALYDLRMIQSEELERIESKDINKWLAYAQNQEEEAVYWLYRQDSGEYVLYLPGQDRVLLNADLSATEEKMPDGRMTLVVRARTPEQSETIVPEQQLFCMKSDSQEWDGQRVRVILDGREQTVIQSSAQGNRVYAADGMEIE